MPTGPKGDKRPADAVGAAIMAILATGETTKDPSRNRNGGLAAAKARAVSLTAEQRTAVSKRAAAGGWS